MSKEITTIEYENALRIVRDYEAQQLRSIIQEEMVKAVSEMQPPVAPQDELMSIHEAARFLSLSVATLYGKVSSMSIPVNKRAGRLYFSKAELMDWVRDGRKMTEAEVREETRKNAEKWVATKKK